MIFLNIIVSYLCDQQNRFPWHQLWTLKGFPLQRFFLLIDEYFFSLTRIINVDETGITRVPGKTSFLSLSLFSMRSPDRKKKVGLISWTIQNEIFIHWLGHFVSTVKPRSR